MWDEYVWIVVVGAFMCLFMSYGIGANDVANSFATSVGSRTLTLFQACVLAGICEFAGAVLLGRGVSSTIKSGIVNVDYFTDAPEIVMYGMLCALCSSGTWLILATAFELPVSTTHSIVGAIVGWGLVAGGKDTVIWYEIDDSKDFPLGGIAAIVVSWVFSPVVSGIIAALFFLITRTLILRSTHSYERAYTFLPVLVFLCFFINAFYVLDKGVSKQWKASTTTKSAWIAAIVGVIAGLAAIPVAILLKNRQTRQREEGIEAAKQEAANPEVAKAADSDSSGKKSSFFQRMQDAVNSNNPHGCLDDDEDLRAMHDNAEVFEERTEGAFKYLQVLTSMAASFAHGANDVANAVGPFAAIYAIYKTGTVASESDAEEWILVLGGLGIVVGLATYGYKIIRAIGVRLTKITPSRGYCMELGTSLVVVTGSYLGLPLSTTHCIVGATTAVGLLEGGKGVSWRVIAKSVTGWVFTLIVAGLLSALIMALGVFTPNLRSVQAANNVHMAVQNMGLGLTNRVGDLCANPTLQATIQSANNTIEGVTINNARYPNRVADVVTYLGAFNDDTSTVVCPPGGTITPVPSKLATAYPNPYKEPEEKE